MGCFVCARIELVGVCICHADLRLNDDKISLLAQNIARVQVSVSLNKKCQLFKDEEIDVINSSARKITCCYQIHAHWLVYSNGEGYSKK